MPKIHIGALEVESLQSVDVEPGGGLLVGRAPDLNRIDWSSLVLPTSLSSSASTPESPDGYRLRTLTVASGQVSANHLLVLAGDDTAAVYDLGSRNGSFMQLVPQRPLMVRREPEILINLAGPHVQEPMLERPRDAKWKEATDFGPAVVAALCDWFREARIPVRVIRHDPYTRKDGLLLADDSIIELEDLGTLQISGTTLIEKVADYVHAQNARFWQLERRVSGLVAASPAIKQILARTAESAANGRRTLFLGPTGVGKELLARSYHAYSPRHSSPFVTVNCALLEKELLYAQLFGARRGSFTGAVADVPGLIEAAHGGTLFLDELGEMNLDVQKALLRFLDSRGEYYRLGDPRARTADVQVIGASNAPLDDPTYRNGRFRDDLWYRLAGSVVLVPALADRPEDVRAFLQNRMLHGSKWSVAECLTEDALEHVLADPWPGNFRDVENFIDRLPRVNRTRSIDRAACVRAIHEGRPSAASPKGTELSAREEPVVPEASSAPILPAPSEKEPDLPVRTEASGPYPVESPSRGAARLREQSRVPTNAELGWSRIVNVALNTFLEDQSERLTGWDQLQLFVEHYLKPMFVSHAASTTPAVSSTRTINYSAIARRLHIGDGGTVKTHLSRFQERFANALLAEDARSKTGTTSGTPD